MGQKRRFKSLPATSGLHPSTDIIRPVRLVRLVHVAVGTGPGELCRARWSRTAKSCGPGAPMVAASRGEMHPARPGLRCTINPQANGGKQAGHRGEHEVSRKPFVQGKPE